MSEFCIKITTIVPASDFPEWLLAARKRSDKPVGGANGLAAAADLSRQQWREYEQGTAKSIDLGVLRRIERALGEVYFKGDE